MSDENWADFITEFNTMRAAIGTIAKDSTAHVVSKKTGAKYTYHYASLPAILEAAEKPLQDNNFSIFQCTRYEGGELTLVSELRHGPTNLAINSVYPVHVGGPQDTGSELTYARRYSITTLLCLAPDDDDDGARAQQSRSNPKPRQKSEKDTQGPKRKAEKDTTADSIDNPVYTVERIKEHITDKLLYEDGELIDAWAIGYVTTEEQRGVTSRFVTQFFENNYDGGEQITRNRGIEMHANIREAIRKIVRERDGG